MEKINLVKILKDCPKGMELDCTICNGVKFRELDRNPNFPIVVRANNGYEFTLTKYGQVHNIDESKCVIFPKGKDSWEGFVPPVGFKDGDIVATNSGAWIGIMEKQESDTVMTTHCVIKSNGSFEAYIGEKERWRFSRLANEEERDRLFKAIKDNGYKWNAEKKCLEKLVEPKFKVGDRIKHVVGRKEVATVVGVKETYYILESKVGTSAFTISLQHEWELASKFDINTLKPFDKVLVRNSNDLDWACDLFSHLRHEDSLLNRFRCIDMSYKYCIPYEGNEHLRGTNNDCDEFYKTWEE